MRTVNKTTVLYFLVQTLCYAIAIALATWLLPGFTVTPERLWPYLVLGASLGILNAVVRPAILVLTGRLLIETMGLFVFVVNAIILLLLNWLFSHNLIFPLDFHIDGILSALVAAVIIGLVATVLEVVFGMTQPITADDYYERTDWRGLEKLPTGRRNRFIENMRMQQVYSTFWRYGLDIVFDKSFLSSIRAAMQKRLYPNTSPMADLSTPAKVRLMLQELGPTYVKIGQMASSRAESLPPEWREELVKLQSSVPPFPTEAALQIIQSEIGKPAEELFTDFDPVPLAAASTAQVHRATLPDGQKVVVKVQRPDIEIKVKADLGIIGDISHMAEKRTSWGRNYGLEGMVKEFSKNVIDELDYRNEAYNARRLAASMATFPTIHVPTIYGEWSRRRVLTMEFIKGVKITNVAAIDAAGLDRIEIARTFITAFVKQILFDGFFHGDPHPGNILIDTETGHIIFLDCGMMGSLSQEQRMNLGDLIWSFSDRDPLEISRVMVRLSTKLREDFDEAAFIEDLDRLLGRIMIFPDEDYSLASTLTAIFEMMFKHGLKLDSDLTMAIKALGQAEENARTLDPSIYITDVAFEASRGLMWEQLNWDNASSTVRREATRSFKEVIRRVPTLHDATMKWLDQYQSGRLTLFVDTQDLGRQLGKVQFGFRQLAIALILVGMVIGSAVIAVAPNPTTWTWLPQVMMGFFAFAMLLSAMWVVGLMFGYFKTGD